MSASNEKPEVGGGRADQFKGAEKYKELSVELDDNGEYPARIEKTDIKPHAIALGETEIVLQRHGKYERDRTSEGVGSLTPEAVTAEKAAAAAYFEAFLRQLPEEERGRVDVLVVASDTQYFDGGRRSHETAELAQQAALEVFEAQGLPSENIINTSGRLRGEGGPRPMPRLREPNMLNESPEFLNYMLDKYGGENRELTLDFWVAFEEDKEKEVRERMGAEGPGEIADRTAFSVRALARYAEAYHAANPDRRLIIWGATHYDTISPFVKREVFEVPKEQQLMVDYGAGITIDISADGKASTEIDGKQYEVPLTKRDQAEG